ncbi:MAG TPA: AtzH-like domain-containing protein, partial [Terracidiphilus sp.]|nr:AtzH-like domain-containing protein [Terracidiphilus sp.]
MIVNDPEVVAELSALYLRYEEALVNNDADTLINMFWAGPQVMRFGAAENLYGPEDLAAFRKTR